ncbi:MAG: hypothetical protein R6V25_15940 [Desulfatiglandales bacterium]
MLYVERDKDGMITAITTTKTPNATDVKPAIDAEVINFLKENDHEDSLRLSLSLLDIGLIRTIEDLINLLIQKKIIFFTELPVEAQKRIRERQRIREKLSSDSFMVEDIL